MRKFLLFFYVPVLLGISLLGIVACSNELGGAKGNVVNVLTGKPIVGAEVIATTKSNIESKQRYRRFVVKTDKSGSFQIKGMRRKKYEVEVLKEGYSTGKTHVTIPEESNVIIENPIKLCPLPSRPGVYAFANKFIELKTKPFHTATVNGRKYLFYEAKNLQDVPAVKTKHLIIYKTPNIGTMCRLFTHSNKKGFGQDSETKGEYCSTGGSQDRRARTYGEFSLGRVGNKIIRPDSNPEHISGDLWWVFRHTDLQITVYNLDCIPKGFYHIGHQYQYERYATCVLNLE